MLLVLLRRLLSFGLIVLCVYGHGAHHHHDHRHLDGEEVLAKCSTPEGHDHDVRQQTRALGLYEQAIRNHRGEDSVADTIVVPVCFHVIQHDNGTERYSNELFQNQMDALNRAFGADSCCDSEKHEWCHNDICSLETGIRFAFAAVNSDGDLIAGETVGHLNHSMACFERINESAYTLVSLNGDTDREMKKKFRKGDASVLNVYWTDLSGFLGYATFPWAYSLEPDMDGIVLRAGTAPGGGFAKYDEGDTLVHEIGHWLGLFHTFQGGCDVSDGVLDTPPEKYPFYGCGGPDGSPVDRDSCHGDTSSDPVFNFMDYSDDACLFHWTEGQVSVMKACYSTFRLGNSYDTEETALEPGVPSEPTFLLAMQEKIYTFESDSAVRCSVSVSEGQANVYMRWNRRPAFNMFFDSKTCLKGLFNSGPNCEVEYPTGMLPNFWPFTLFQPKGMKKLYIGIVPVDGWTLQDVSLTCA